MQCNDGRSVSEPERSLPAGSRSEWLGFRIRFLAVVLNLHTRTSRAFIETVAHALVDLSSGQDMSVQLILKTTHSS